MFLHQRKPALFGLAACCALCSSAAHAQMHHVEKPERVTRAIGVYEWTGDLNKPAAARFVPVSLFIDGHFEDAGLYLARPIPFALEPGDVYAIEHAGQPEGLLDLDFARRVVTGNALADDDPEGAWYAYGRFTPEAAPRLTPLQPSHHLPSIQASAGPNTPAGTKVASNAPEDSDRPHLGRRDSSTQTPTQSSPQSSPQTPTQTAPANPPAPSQTPSSTPSSNSGSTTASNSDDDTDRPTLRRRDPSKDASRRREYGKKGSTSGVTAAGPALGDDPDRPILGRGKPADAATPELTGLPPDMHQAVAVSDATHNDDHPFARAWDSPAERADTLAAMEALAKPRVAAYLAENKLVPSSEPLPSASAGAVTAPVPGTAAAAVDNQAGGPPRLQRGIPKQYQEPHPAASAAPAGNPGTASESNSPAHRPANHPTAHHRTRAAAKAVSPTAPPLNLAQETLSGFTLSYGGLPTFVYTAAAAVAPGQDPAGTAPGTNPAVYITLVAQRLPSGKLQVALGSVTDSAHLDRTPRLRLIDAVDPDDSHRASLLFELRGNSGRQFALYRLTSAEAEQTFTTASIE